VKVQYGEGRTSHTGPEPCGVSREGCGEASAGESAGQPLSLESPNPGADAVLNVEGNMAGEKIVRSPVGLAGSKNLACAETSCTGTGRPHDRPQAEKPTGPRRGGEKPKPPTNGHEGSDSVIVAVKPTNKAGRPAAEPVEPRTEAEENAGRQSRNRVQDRIDLSQALARVRKAAKERKNERFTSLLHHVNPERLRESYFALKRNAAPGADGVTWKAYGEDLDRKLIDLHDRIHRGAYRAQPSRRQYIPKADGTQRPLALAALEDKIVQRAVADVLEAIHEQDFMGFSYGFRPGRNAHDAMDALIVGIDRSRVNWVLDVDIRSFFDTVSQEWLVRFLEHRIADRRIIRLIRKWLKAGILEEGKVVSSDRGTGQGSVISPILANIYLHYVIDLWAGQWRRREAKGNMIIVRYADDMVLGFEHEADAKRFRDAMQQRLETFALSLHPDKTRLIEFGRRAAASRKQKGLGKPETFRFLGFTFVCGKSRTGKFLVKRKTRKDRMQAKLKDIKEVLRRDRHKPIPVLGKWLGQVAKGYYAYHAVPTNSAGVMSFRYHVVDLLRRTLLMRGQRDRTTWAKARKIADAYIPRPRIVHPWPSQRFAVRHPRWEPYAGMPHVRICAGGAQ
jgi:RNA-directed DNA polymerase